MILEEGDEEGPILEGSEGRDESTREMYQMEPCVTNHCKVTLIVLKKCPLSSSWIISFGPQSLKLCYS